MANLASHKRTQGTRTTKVKTGCATCRVRKVKCDEAKPFCRRCVDTGRTCDGYASPFRVVTVKNVAASQSGGRQLSQGRICAAGQSLPDTAQPTQLASAEITPQEVRILARCFSTKTVFDVELGCDQEARHILLASRNDPPIRHALASLRALRGHFEAAVDDTGSVSSVAQLDPSDIFHVGSVYKHGLQQYSMALKGLVSNLSTQGASRLSSALLCCQIFISIEQVQGHYAAMVQHMVRGLDIMREHRARPYWMAAENKLATAAHDGQVPLLDAFIIKMFAAPCKFSEPGTDGTSPHQQDADAFHRLRTLAPDMRTRLTRIASSMLEFLDRVSGISSATQARQLLLQKASLLESLESWLAGLEEHLHLDSADIGQSGTDSGPELISVSFLRLFHQALKIILLGTLDSSADLDAQLRAENNHFQNAASNLDARMQSYRR